MAATTALLLPGLDGTGDLFEPFASVAPPGIETVVVNYPHNESSMEVLEKRVAMLLLGLLTTREIVEWLIYGESSTITR